MTSPAAVLRHRRLVARRTDRVRSNDRLSDAARGLRREAEVYLSAGRPDLAEPYLDEARLFEDATRPVPGL